MSDSQTLPAKVVVYDPERDVAVLDVPGLDAPALRFAPHAGRTAATRPSCSAIPEDGPFNVRSARVRSRDTVSGNDIYGNDNVHRDIYSIYAVVRSGNSGGPLLAANGTVLGVVFATALESSNTGYVLTDGEIARGRGRGARMPRPRSAPGDCTPG